VRSGLHGKIMPLLAAPEVALHSPFSCRRSVVECYIKNKFASVYGANIQEFMPYLMTLSRHDKISAAVGMRPAQEHSLYVENYLQKPVECEIKALTGISTRREHIVEIGNLVSTWRGSSQLLFMLLTQLLCRLGYEWAVFTATNEVEKLLGRLKLSTFTLSKANPAVLGEQGKQWGRYYDRDPHVMLGHLPGAVAQLQENALTEYICEYFSSLIDELAGQGQCDACPLMPLADSGRSVE
jgi:hypothetical protein